MLQTADTQKIVENKAGNDSFRFYLQTHEQNIHKILAPQAYNTRDVWCNAPRNSFPSRYDTTRSLILRKWFRFNYAYKIWILYIVITKR